MISHLRRRLPRWYISMASFFPSIPYEHISRALRALPNPLYGFIFCFLFIFTIPLAIIASITTTFAFSILLFRVALVYIELALAVIPYYTFGSQTATASVKAREPSPGVVQLLPPRRRRRRSSSSSTLSAGSLTPGAGDVILGQSVGPARDFEGVGGWRIGDRSDEESSWTNVNSRLELPALHGRRHFRSLTSGSVPSSTKLHRNHSPEAVMNTSRARTPPSMRTTVDGYFPPSVTGSSASSKSSGLSMKQR